MQNRLRPFVLAAAALSVVSAPSVLAEEAAPKLALGEEPRFEIEAQYVSISTEDMQQLGLTPLPFDKADGPYKLASVPADIQAKLAALISEQKAKVVTAPRVTAKNNSGASLRSTTLVPIAWGTENTLGEPYYFEGNSFIRENDYHHLRTKNSLLYLGSGIGLDAKPKLNDDGTINLSFNPSRLLSLHRTTRLGGRNWDETSWQRNLKDTQFFSHLQSGQTIALLGDSSLAFGLSNTPQKITNMVVLVRATRIEK